MKKNKIIFNLFSIIMVFNSSCSYKKMNSIEQKSLIFKILKFLEGQQRHLLYKKKSKDFQTKKVKIE